MILYYMMYKLKHIHGRTIKPFLICIIVKYFCYHGEKLMQHATVLFCSIIMYCTRNERDIKQNPGISSTPVPHRV